MKDNNNANKNRKTIKRERYLRRIRRKPQESLRNTITIIIYYCLSPIIFWEELHQHEVPYDASHVLKVDLEEDKFVQARGIQKEQIWGFPWPWGYLKTHGLFHGKSQSKIWMIWGYPYFRKPPIWILGEDMMFLEPR